MVTSSSRGGEGGGESLRKGRYHQMEFDISNGFWITTDREVLCMHDNYIILMNITIMLPTQHCIVGLYIKLMTYKSF